MYNSPLEGSVCGKVKSSLTEYGGAMQCKAHNLVKTFTTVRQFARLCPFLVRPFRVSVEGRFNCPAGRRSGGSRNSGGEF